MDDGWGKGGGLCQQVTFGANVRIALGLDGQILESYELISVRVRVIDEL